VETLDSVETLVKTTPQRVELSVEAHGLVKSFRFGDQTVHAADGVDISIARGETVALLRTGRASRPPSTSCSAC
jgi:hypothetical protein